VQSEWAESADTVEGRGVHRRLDRGPGALPEPEEIGDDEGIHARSVTLSSERLGLIAKLDLIEAEDGAVQPVDYKRGRRPHVPSGAWEPELVQLCVQGLILETTGIAVTRVRSISARAASGCACSLTRRRARRRSPPSTGCAWSPPVVASRRRSKIARCPRCSLVGICLPDEVNYFRHGGAPRPLAVDRELALPVYVQATPARVRKRGETLVIQTEDEKETTARLVDTSHLVLMGAVDVTAPILHELMRREIPVSWYTGGWFLGHTTSTGHRNVELRTAQYQASFDPVFCLRLARGLVASKLRNGRTLLRRNWRGEAAPDHVLGGLQRSARAAAEARDLAELLGVEGYGGAIFFGGFGAALRSEPDAVGGFEFRNRNRRPPTDPVNTVLSFLYALLVRKLNVILSAVGFDSYRGFYHQPRYGRPALALDMMEPFRPLIAESTALTAINNGEVRKGDFVYAGRACALGPAGCKKVIAAFERRLGQEITHPLFGYRLSYRRLLEVQARLLGRHLMGEIAELPAIEPR
jgi:CRISPR-associated endonuclease Cas1